MDIVWGEFADSVDADHERLDTPAVVALMHRQLADYTEVMWARGYPGAKMITITVLPVLHGEHDIPGVVQVLPVGWRDLASAETFKARFYRALASYESRGWVRKDASVRS